MSRQTPEQQRCAGLKRAIEVARLLADRALTLAELARHLGVTTRTIRRDLYMLQAVGVDFIRVDVGTSVNDDEDDEDDENDSWPMPAEARKGQSYRAVKLRLYEPSWHTLLRLPAA